MSEAVKTLEGWYCLHDFRKMNWPLWKKVDPAEREEIIEEFFGMLKKWNETEEKKEGSHVIYSIVGQKADFVFMVMRPTMDELNALENEFNKSRLAEYTLPAYSYVSVVEISGYLAGGKDPNTDPEIQARLKPILPKWEYFCFYPMSKKREGKDNWYMLPMEDRRVFMRGHGATGRRYAEKVKQITTGSVGFDDWEWGITLFAHDVLQFKKLVYEMRFDEASARFGQFGSFFVGTHLDDEKIKDFLKV